MLAENDEPYVARIADESRPSIPNTRPNAMLLVDGQTRAMYEFEMDDASLEIVGKHLQAAGYANPHYGDGGDAAGTRRDENSGETRMQARGWSSGVDNRLPKTIYAHGANHWPYRTIGQFKWNQGGETYNGYCTGTFVGVGTSTKRYVLTAAHCLWQELTGFWQDPDFWPRQDRCQTANGANVPGCDQSPYGRWDVSSALMPLYFTEHCLGETDLTSECQANDIAVVEVNPEGDAVFPGSPGFAYWGYSDLQQVTKYHRGYPNCDQAGEDPAPAPPEVCLPRTLYGDGPLGLGFGLSVDASGWPRRYPHGADTSPGHSGGPAYFEFDNNYYVFGVDSVSTCKGSACTSLTPNRMRAINEQFFYSILNFSSP